MIKKKDLINIISFFKFKYCKIKKIKKYKNKYKILLYIWYNIKYNNIKYKFITIFNSRWYNLDYIIWLILLILYNKYEWFNSGDIIWSKFYEVKMIEFMPNDIIFLMIIIYLWI